MLYTNEIKNKIFVWTKIMVGRFLPVGGKNVFYLWKKTGMVEIVFLDSKKRDFAT